MKRIGLFAVVCAAALLLSACDGAHDLTAPEVQTAKVGAYQYGGANMEVVSVSPRDSDGDAYVSVTMRDRNDGKTSVIQCAYRGSEGGCKPGK